IAQMPDCYLPADTTQIIPPPPSRAAAGLPEEGLVFCSFNNSYKYNPDVFDVWANLLQQIEGSILWLSHPGDTAAGHLRDELSKRNIDWERLIFAGRLKSHADHLARIQVADLALDTFPYNSHSTGIDTLRAGVPMIALLGDTFAGRVGASLLHSAGLDDLIASTRENYLDLALALARNPQRLEMYRNRLAMNAKTSPLFDMKKFADNLESVYFRMWQNYSKGERHPILCI
ncbi:MAG TPA: acetylglucosamine transferase, partial [Rhodocyclaceae bacterium]|nr:acetylglucosamine transferase [Rhodocyclaceae bacterium]